MLLTDAVTFGHRHDSERGLRMDQSQMHDEEYKLYFS